MLVSQNAPCSLVLPSGQRRTCVTTPQQLATSTVIIDRVIDAVVCCTYAKAWHSHCDACARCWSDRSQSGSSCGPDTLF